ncbi:endolytic transglycosylase MltG [Clostridium sp. MSJ-11]|uniref:Endolytic murein transglycosylase n=1 Tax=Clostridium mobile TaxID=2841512 RepID=A0ABS6EIH8_9CLOT|nr:endolytic transglycosylase MltG [Clostridium mobile]MBU5484947.1 endolytic transglycosylase MltG [Clostridium mobile]
MKRKGFIISIILLLSIAFLGYFYYNSIVKHPFKGQGKEVEILVNKGDSLYKVLDTLKDEGEIKNLLFIKAYIKQNKLDTNIKPGDYVIDSDVTLENLILDLNKGLYNKNLVNVTIPEGYDISKIGDVLEEKGIISKEDFIKGIEAYPLPKYIKEKGNRKYAMEGYLFPDTYMLAKDMKAEDIIDIMHNRFNKALNELRKDYRIDDDKIDTIITVASMVEKEAEVDSERGKVASVFYNRMNKNMKMQSCATVLYALGEHREKLYNKDLQVKSPYNTYIVEGFPPGPIASPGMSSIEAALKPEKTNYLFFVSYNDGTHFFTDNYNEFLKVKEKTQGN